MLELTRTQRSRQVERLLKEVIAAVPGDVVLLDNLEILFDTSPGGRTAASAPGGRAATAPSSPRGTAASGTGTLTYAEPGHPEFIQFKQTEAVVITVGTSAKN